MAVRVLSHSPARPAARAAALPPIVLGLALLPAALDLLQIVEASLVPWLAIPSACATAAAAAVLVVMWLRFPRTSWLAAASIACVASLALRLAGAEVAPALSLLSIVALGLGGAFAAREPAPANS